MRKKDIRKAVASFDKACDDLLAFINAIEETKIGGQAVSWAHEYAIIRLYREFETLMLGIVPPGLDHYWRELSFNNINLAGSVVRGWYTLPQPRSYYVHGTPPALDPSTERTTQWDS